MPDDSLSVAFANRAELERTRRDPRPAPNADAALASVQQRMLTRTKTGGTIKPADVIKLARQRLRDVRRELKATRKNLRSLEREETELSRLLDAADGKPNRPASVRELRRPA